MIRERKNRGREKALCRNLFWLWVHALFVSIIVLALSSGSAHTMAADLADLGNAAQSPLKASTDADIVRTLGLLRRQVEENGTARIIVGLRVVFTPEGELSAMAATQQQKEIAKVQSLVLEKVPALKHRAETIKRFNISPYMALEVNAAELEALVSLAEIVSIEADQLAAPAFGTKGLLPESR